MKTVLTNGKIYTCDEALPVADTLAYDGKEIYYIGLGSPDTEEVEVIDLKGRTVIPGIIDSHIHPGMLSKSSWHVRLPWTEDIEEILAFVKDYADNHPKEEVPFLYFEYYPTSVSG